MRGAVQSRRLGPGQSPGLPATTIPMLDLSAPPAPANMIRRLGPGLITGAADDDPSGIATYSQVGAQFGYALGWTMLFSLPFMIVIQEISARIGCVTRRSVGRGGPARRGFRHRPGHPSLAARLSGFHRCPPPGLPHAGFSLSAGRAGDAGRCAGSTCARRRPSLGVPFARYPGAGVQCAALPRLWRALQFGAQRTWRPGDSWSHPVTPP